MKTEAEAPFFIRYSHHGIEIAHLELGPAIVCDFKKVAIVPLFEHLKLNLPLAPRAAESAVVNNHAAVSMASLLALVSFIMFVNQ